MAGINFHVMYRKDRQKRNNAYPVVIRVNIKGRTKYFPLDFDVVEKDWNPQGQIMVKRSDPGHYYKNKRITDSILKITLIEGDNINKNLSFEAFEALYFDDAYGSESFYDYVNQYIDKRKNTAAPGTLQFYNKHLSKMRKFRPELSFSDIDLDFIHAYRDYMIEELNNKEITWYKSLEFIRRVLNAAIKEDKISKTPFRHFAIKNVRGGTDHLTVEELSALHKAWQDNTLPKNKANVLRYFLFACYTGVRWATVVNMSNKDLTEENGRLWLKYTHSKNKKPVKIPLIDQAKELLPEKGLPEAKVFRTLTNQPTNRYIKEAVKVVLGIDKNIKFHSARHTCNNILIKIGVPIEIRVKIIGDTAKVIRDFYTNIDEDQIAESLNKMNAELTKNLIRG